jgi:hypothetical protein
MAKADGGQTTKTPTNDEISRKNIGAMLLERLSATITRRTSPKTFQKMNQNSVYFESISIMN